MKRGVIRLLVLAACLALLATAGGCASKKAGTVNVASAQQRLVESAAEAVRGMGQEHRNAFFAEALENAEAVLIFPHYLRLGFFFSAEGSDGVLLVRDAFGAWSSPAFYTMGMAGYGLQAGIEGGDLIFVFFDREDVLEGLESGFQFDADMSATVLTGVDRIQAGNMTEDKAVVLFTDTTGLFVGASLSGGWVAESMSANAAYYGSGEATPDQIVLHWTFWRSEARPLWEALQDAAQPGLQPLDPPKKKDGTGVPSLPSRMG
ncbi:MAG: lipid-binding SYLF domain-containing protein [Desulfovibrionaceae bacterium]